MVKVLRRDGYKAARFDIFDEVGFITLGIGLYNVGDNEPHPNIHVSKCLGKIRHPDTWNNLMNDALEFWAERGDDGSRNHSSTMQFFNSQTNVEEFTNISVALDSLLKPICEELDAYTDELETEIDQKIEKLKQKMVILQVQKRELFLFRNSFYRRGNKAPLYIN